MVDNVQPAPEILSETAPVAPKRRGRPPGSKNSTSGTSRRGRPRKSMADRIGGVLTMVNLVFAFAPRQYQADALDMTEISALSKALDDAARENQTLYKYLDAALGGTGSAMLNLGIVAVCIGGRRLARHDMYISREWDARLGAFVAMQAGPIDKDAVDFGQLFSMVDSGDNEATASNG